MAEKEYIDKVAFNYAIREAVKKYPNSFYNGLEVARQIAHDFPAADAIEALADRNVGKWIPVTERLPDKPGIYAVWTAKGFGNHLSASYFDGDSWSLRITHWMPLPTPPTAEEGE